MKIESFNLSLEEIQMYVKRVDLIVLLSDYEQSCRARLEEDLDWFEHAGILLQETHLRNDATHPLRRAYAQRSPKAGKNEQTSMNRSPISSP